MFNENQEFFHNQTSIPSSAIIIPNEKIQNNTKYAFGRSQPRFGNDKKNVINMVLKKFKNINNNIISQDNQQQQSNTKANKSFSVYENNQSNNQQSKMNKSFIMPKKIVQPRQFIPQHRSHLIEVTQKYQDAYSTQNSTFSCFDPKSQQNKKKQNLYFKSLSQATNKQDRTMVNIDFHPDCTNISNFSYYNSENFQGGEAKPQSACQNILPQSNLYEGSTANSTFYKNQVSEKYRKTHKSAFQGPSREALQMYEQRNYCYQPGPGDYNINGVFEKKLEINKQQLLKKQEYQQDQQQQQFFEINEQEQNESIKIDQQNFRQANHIHQRIKNYVKDYSPNNNNGKQQLLQNSDIQESQLQYQQKQDQKNLRMQHMFVKDDRDRFGQQIFPLAGRDRTPAPNYYFTDNFSLEYKKNKIIAQEKQKQLLKLWLHPNNFQL